MLRHYSEAMLLIKFQGAEIFTSKRFKYLSKKFDFKCQLKELNEYVLAFKTQAYKKFISLLRTEYGFEDCDLKDGEFEINKTDPIKEDKDLQIQRN